MNIAKCSLVTPVPLMWIPCLFMSPSEVMNWDTKKSMKRMLSTAGKPKLCKNLLNASYLWGGKIWQDNSYVYSFSQAILMLIFFTFSSSVNINVSSSTAHKCSWHSNTAAFCSESAGRNVETFLGHEQCWLWEWMFRAPGCVMATMDAGWWTIEGPVCSLTNVFLFCLFVICRLLWSMRLRGRIPLVWMTSLVRIPQRQNQ